MLVQPQPTATVCELDLVRHAIRSSRRAQTLDPNQRMGNCQWPKPDPWLQACPCERSWNRYLVPFPRPEPPV